MPESRDAQIPKDDAGKLVDVNEVIVPKDEVEDVNEATKILTQALELP